MDYQRYGKLTNVRMCPYWKNRVRATLKDGKEDIPLRFDFPKEEVMPEWISEGSYVEVRAWRPPGAYRVPEAVVETITYRRSAYLREEATAYVYGDEIAYEQWMLNSVWVDVLAPAEKQ